MPKFSPQDKLNITLQLIAGDASAEELSRQYGFRSPKTVYNWRTRLMESAVVIFQERRGIRPRDRNPAPRVEPGDEKPEPAEIAIDGVLIPEDEADREMQDLFGIDLVERRRRTRKLPARKGESKRGRMNLKRMLAINEAKKARIAKSKATQKPDHDAPAKPVKF